MSLFAFVKVDDFLGVDGKISVRVDDDAKEARVRVNQPRVISVGQVF